MFLLLNINMFLSFSYENNVDSLSPRSRAASLSAAKSHPSIHLDFPHALVYHGNISNDMEDV